MRNLETAILALSTSYLIVRGSQLIFQFAKGKYYQNYLPLKRALQYRKNKEVYHYHLFHYSQKLINEKKFKKGKRSIQKILKENPDYQLANYLMGIALYHENQFLEAKEYFQKEISISPNHPMVYFFLSKCFCHLEEWETALKMMKKSIEINPYHYSCYLVAIEIFAHLKINPREEWEFFRLAEKSNCLVKPVWEHMTRLETAFLSQEEQQERLEIYKKLDEAWQESTKIKEKIVHAMAGKQLFQAENLAIEGLQLNPNDNQLYQLYDQILITQKKFSVALDFYQNQLKRINPNPLEASLRLSDYLVYNQKYKQALDVMLEIFHHYSNAKFLHYPLCILYNWLNQPMEALNHLAQAIYFDKGVKDLAKKNPELKNLREEEQFKSLV